MGVLLAGLSEHKIKKWLSHELSCSVLWLPPLLFQSSLDLPQGSVALTVIVPGSDEPLARGEDQTSSSSSQLVASKDRTRWLASATLFLTLSATLETSLADKPDATTGPVVLIVWRTKTARRERGVNLASVEGGLGERGLVEGKAHNLPSIHH